jgi:hypothetical protein
MEIKKILFINKELAKEYKKKDKCSKNVLLLFI